VLDAFRASPVAQLVLDADNVVVAGNEPLRVLFGIGEREVGAVLKDLEISYRPFELRSLIERAHAQEEPVVGDRETWYARDGTEHHLEVEVSALRSDGRLTGTTVSFRDVTGHVSMTAELEQSKHELENAYEELQSTVEELETTNEELQSTNEELETTNEELTRCSACGRCAIKPWTESRSRWASNRCWTLASNVGQRAAVQMKD
jgi:two-component system CheB/CheR fusion protein